LLSITVDYYHLLLMWCDSLTHRHQ